MRAPLARLRPSVVATVAVAAAIGLAAAYFAFLQLSHPPPDVRHQQAEADAMATLLAGELGQGDSLARLAPYVPLLVQEGQQVTVTGPGGTAILGLRIGESEEQVIQARRSFPGGTVVVQTPLEQPTNPGELFGVAAGLLMAVLGVAAVANVVASRQTRRQVDAAVRAAERVTQGDMSVRIGSNGPAELARLGEAFDQMAARLESSERDQRRFLADLAHEIATPVNTLAGFASAVLDGTIPRERAEQVINAQTARLSELLDELTALRELDRTHAGQREPVDLAGLCRQLAAEHAPAQGRPTVVAEASARRAVAVTDPRLVRTVLGNFLSNAVRYTPDGQVTVGVRRERHRLVLYVRDTGPGIAPEHLERIFDRFYRVQDARDRASGGSGLGLAIARRAADALGGFVEVTSTVGQGSEFRLVLPRGPAGPSPAGPPPAGPG